MEQKIYFTTINEIDAQNFIRYWFEDASKFKVIKKTFDSAICVPMFYVVAA